MVNTKICAVCGSEKMKIGKLLGVAALQPLNSRIGIGGSDLHVTFCADCGEVMGIKVADPDKIK